MSANTPSQAGTKAQPEKVIVPIPRAKPGQGYKAPKNYQHPFWDSLTKVVVVLMCLVMPVVPGLIYILILLQPSSVHFLWLWIPMIFFVEAIAIFCAIGVAREALGATSRADYTAPTREVR